MAKGTYNEKIVAILQRRNMVPQPDLQKAIEACQSNGKRLEEYLVEENIVSDTNMVLVNAEYLDMTPITLANFTPDARLLELIPSETIMKSMAIPVAQTGKVLTMALSDPFNAGIIDELESLTGMTVFPLVACEREIKELLNKYYQAESQDLEDIFKDAEEAEEVELSREKEEEISLDEMLESAEGAPVIRIVNSVMVEALRRNASDIHIEPTEKALRLRYRVDGDLFEVPSPPKNLQSAIISRIKIMSDMDIAKRRIPQDGRINVRALGKDVDIRVSLLPLIHGEKIVMRILDRSNLAAGVSDLGLDQKACESLVFAISQPHGIILVTGPTGSGKTTTLYSCLQDLNKSDVNIVTTEDPVEYQLDGINQVQINDAVGLTFAKALRAILRQDPDIVMVGEIRDQETASIAVKAALTGHLVLSTLHTNDASGAITRLRDMGVEAFLLASSLIMTQAQRLYKNLCPACKRPTKISEDVLRLNNLDPKHFQGGQFYDPVGCPKCAGIGFKGRGALMEILMVNNAIRDLILKSASSNALAEQAISDGMMTLRMIGIEKIKQGISSLEEILRVTGGGE